MVSSKETTPAAYLASLPPERRAVIASLRKLINERVPDGYVESMSWGMLCWEVPLSRYPDTYNKQPLSYVALAAQKNNYSLYLTAPYADERIDLALKEAFSAAGKKMDAGKSCIRFSKLDDLPLDAIGDAIAATPVDRLVELAEAARSSPRGSRSASAAKPSKPAASAASAAAAKPAKGVKQAKKAARKAT